MAGNLLKRLDTCLSNEFSQGISPVFKDVHVIDLNFETLNASFFENQIHVLQADRPFPFSLFFLLLIIIAI